MTGKQLKRFAATVPDDAVIEVRETWNNAWRARFIMQAKGMVTLECNADDRDEDEEGNG